MLAKMLVLGFGLGVGEQADSMSNFTVNKPAKSQLPGVSNPLSNIVDSGDMVPGDDYILFDLTVDAGKILYLSELIVTCSQPGIIKVIHTIPGEPNTVNQLISGRISVGTTKNYSYSWDGFKTIAQDENVKVVFTLHDWAASSDVEAYLLTRLETI